MKRRDVTVTGPPLAAGGPGDTWATGKAGEPVDADKVRTLIRRIVNSSVFAQAPRSKRMLEYVAEATITGRTRDLTESVLAVELFERDGSFDPGSDSIVRANARRLREKLDAYYAGEGRGDAVRVEMPKGHYRLAFQDNAAKAPGTGNGMGLAVLAGLMGLVVVAAVWLWQRDTAAPVQAPLTAIAVLPFDDLSPAGDHAWLGDGMACSGQSKDPFTIAAAGEAAFTVSNVARLGQRQRAPSSRMPSWFSASRKGSTLQSCSHLAQLPAASPSNACDIQTAQHGLGRLDDGLIGVVDPDPYSWSRLHDLL